MGCQIEGERGAGYGGAHMLFERRKQKDQEFKTSLVFIMILGSAWTT